MIQLPSYYVQLCQQLLALGEQREQLLINLQQEFQLAMNKAIQDFRDLKAGSLSLANLTVSDNGWEFVPPLPDVSNNGAGKEFSNVGS